MVSERRLQHFRFRSVARTLRQPAHIRLQRNHTAHFSLGRNTRRHLFTLSEFHNFSPTVLNEFRFGYNRYNHDIPAGNFQFPALDVFPNITIEDDLNLQLGPFDGAPQSTVIKRISSLTTCP